MPVESVTEPPADMTSKPELKLVKRKPSPLDERSFGKSARTHVREFGCTFGILFLLISGYLAIVGGSFATIGACFCLALTIVLLCYQVPLLMLPVWRSWMAFAMFLGHIVTTVLLSIVWTAVLIPISVLLRVLGKRVMDLSYDPSAETYWEDRAEKLHDFKLLERQF